MHCACHASARMREPTSALSSMKRRSLQSWLQMSWNSSVSSLGDADLRILHRVSLVSKPSYRLGLI